MIHCISSSSKVTLDLRGIKNYCQYQKRFIVNNYPQSALLTSPVACAKSCQAFGVIVNALVGQEDFYLRELVRYIHLNPLRAGIVSDFNRLNTYKYGGHDLLMGKESWREGWG